MSRINKNKIKDIMKITGIMIIIFLTMVTVSFVEKIDSIVTNGYGTQIKFTDGTGYWLEKNN